MSEFTDKIDELVVHLETAHATLVSAEQRIAELEAALEPFAAHGKSRCGVCFAPALLRRARLALPPKITGGE